MSKDNINPQHYKNGKVECIDALESATKELQGIEAVCTANAIKYLWRWKQKNGKEDLEKAKWYINKIIDGIEIEDYVKNDCEQLNILAKQELNRLYGKSRGLEKILNKCYKGKILMVGTTATFTFRNNQCWCGEILDISTDGLVIKGHHTNIFLEHKDIISVDIIK